MSTLLQFVGITKRFGGVPVLRDITLALQPGITLGIVGENGAGKSTLLNILGGNLRPDAGRMTWDGRPYAPAGPTDAAAVGIAFVHQELNLFPNLSIGENLFLTRFPRRGRWPIIHRRALATETARWLQEVGLTAPSDTLVERLSAGERQLVEIARALSSEPRLILFDEPTTSLSERETRQFSALMDRLRARGLTTIYISHTLEDVLGLSDEVAVLRDGALVAHGPRAGPDVVRRKAYWAVFSGACGHTYGHNDVYGFFTPAFPGQVLSLGTRPSGPGQRGHWREALEAPGATQMQHLHRMIESRPYLTQAPDRTLVAGPETSPVDHLAAVRGEGYALVYTPTGKPFQVRLDKLSCREVQASWFDPRTGQYQAVGRLACTSQREFIPPEQGKSLDWVLVLDDISRKFPAAETSNRNRL